MTGQSSERQIREEARVSIAQEATDLEEELMSDQSWFKELESRAWRAHERLQTTPANEEL